MATEQASKGGDITTWGGEDMGNGPSGAFLSAVFKWLNMLLKIETAENKKCLPKADYSWIHSYSSLVEANENFIYC